MAFRISLAGCTRFLPEYPVNVSNSFRDSPGHASNINHPRNERPARLGRQRRLRPTRNWDKQKSATFLPKITRQSTSSDLRSQHSALLHFITSTHKRRLRKWGDTDTTGKDGRTRQWNSEAEMAGPEFEDGNNFSANGPTLRYIIDRMPRLVETGPRRLRSLFTIRKRKRRTGGWDREFPTRSVCQLIINNLPVYDEQEERDEGRKGELPLATWSGHPLIDWRVEPSTQFLSSRDYPVATPDSGLMMTISWRFFDSLAAIDWIKLTDKDWVFPSVPWSTTGRWL